MPKDPSTLMRPQMPTPDDELRSQKQRDLYCVLTNEHDEIAALWFQEHVHPEVIAVWGAPDIGSSNSLADGCSQLGVLYTEEPTNHHPDALGRELLVTWMSGYWAGQQWTQYCTLGIGEWFRAFEFEPVTGELCFRHVRPDNVYAVCADSNRTKPVALAELRLRCVDGEWFYAWDVYDIRGPDPSFRTIRGDIDADCRPLKGAEDITGALRAGRPYPARSKDGKPVIPYATYRWMDTGEMWTHQLQRGAYHATLTSAVYWTGVRRAAVHSSGPHVKSVGLKPPAGVLGAGTPNATLTRPILPGSHEYCVADPEYKGGAPQLWIVSPGQFLKDLVSLATEYDVRSLMRFGIDGSDVSRQSAAPESGLALFLHSKAKRMFQTRVTPFFRRADLEALRIASAVLRVNSIETAEDGFSIAYYEIPEAPGEEKERRDKRDWQRERGQISDIDIYIEDHPGTSREAAAMAITAARLEQLRLQAALRVEATVAGLEVQQPPPPPQPPPTTSRGA